MDTTIREMMPNRVCWTFGLVGLLFVAFGAGACGNVGKKKNGQMKVSWQVEPDGCEKAGVNTVEARLEVQGESSSRTKSFDCKTGQGKINGLKPANYKVQLVGLDSDGNEIYDSESTQSVTVRSEETTQAGPFRLTASPAKMVVSWVIGGRCAAKGIETIEVAVFSGGNFEEARKSAKCTKPDVTIGELSPGDYLVKVLGKDESGNTTYKGTAEPTLKQGETKNLEIELEQQ